MVTIDEMFAFVSDDPDGEGVCAVHTATGWMPLMGADLARVESLRPIAQAIADQTGRRIRIVRFTTREEVGTIVPAEEPS